MIKIGVVGDIGSGKSFVSKLFGYPVFNADKEVSKIYKKNKDCFNKLKKKLPKYITSFPIKKDELSKAIISNKKNLKIIEKIVHPRVQQNIKKFTTTNKNKKILVFDIPLLMENKNYKNKYLLIFVDAKKKDIYKNLKKRSNHNPIMLKKLRKSQLSLEIKKKNSNYIIKNDFKILSLKKRVKILTKKLIKNERNNS